MKKVRALIDDYRIRWIFSRMVKGGTYMLVDYTGQKLVEGKILVFLWRIKFEEVVCPKDGIATEVQYLSATGEIIQTEKL